MAVLVNDAQHETYIALWTGSKNQYGNHKEVLQLTQIDVSVCVCVCMYTYTESYAYA